MGKYIIVRSNRLNSFSKRIDSNNLKVLNMFRELSPLLTLFKEIFLKFRFYLPSFFFNNELANLDEADTLIVFDGHARIGFLKWLKTVNPEKRIILWLWNTVDEIGGNLPLNKVPEGIEIWSYSEHDCGKYGLKYNTTFYWDSYTPLDGVTSNDIYFIGKDKGRLHKVKTIEEMCKNIGLNYFFQIVPTHKYSLPRKEYCAAIKYEEVQKNIAESRAILDIKVSPTAGPSIRPLEAAFYKKKLVTDDKDAVSFKFYMKNNIFILGLDDINDLNDFISSDYSDVSKEEIEYYNVQNWLTRFER